VQDQAAPRPATAHRQIERPSRQPAIAYPTEAPAQDPPAALIHDHREVVPLPGDGKVRDVRDPDPIGASCAVFPKQVRIALVHSVQPRIRPVESHCAAS
jgi:hypothetical protein